jgi:hypothetical protein
MRKQLSSCSPNDLSPECLRKSSYTLNAKMEIAVKDLFVRGGKRLIGLLLLAASMFTRSRVPSVRQDSN